MTKRPVDEAIRAFYDTLDADKIAEEPMEEADDEGPSTPGRDEFMEELARGASEMSPDIDHRIAEKSANWKLERMPIVDRNILRLGIYEMSRQDTPAAVVIGNFDSGFATGVPPSDVTAAFRAATCWAS